jgi:hypothetical protein
VVGNSGSASVMHCCPSHHQFVGSMREYRNICWINLYLCLITLLLVFDRLFAFSAVVVSSSSGSTSSIYEHSGSNNRQTSFFRTITTSWLDQEQIPWRRLSKEDKVFPRDIEINNPILEVTSHHSSTLYYLHIIKSQRSRNDCLSSTCTRDITYDKLCTIYE